MIKYSLRCDSNCEFDGWFGSSSAYEVQEAAGQIECPHCGSTCVQKAPMAPRIARQSLQDGLAELLQPFQSVPMPTEHVAKQSEINEVLRRFRADVKARATYVGREFAAEVRQMHFEDAPKRDVWGEATYDEIDDLLDDDIDVFALPQLPEDKD